MQLLRESFRPVFIDGARIDTVTCAMMKPILSKQIQGTAGVRGTILSQYKLHPKSHRNVGNAVTFSHYRFLIADINSGVVVGTILFLLYHPLPFECRWNL